MSDLDLDELISGCREGIIQKVKDVIDESVKFAEDSPEPEAKELYEDVYVGDYPYIIEYKD